MYSQSGRGTRRVPVEIVEQVEAETRRPPGGQARDLWAVARGDDLVRQDRSRTDHAGRLARHAATEISGLPRAPRVPKMDR
jgi:hypothetical protein